MHMSDALLSPPVAAGFWLVSGAAIGFASRRVRQELDPRLVPLMGVLGAFVFASQMINFTIPGTGSSGHLVGTTLLALLLGPHAAFLTMASVLTVQAFLFADGGILALGANIFNLGVAPCYLVYPLLATPRRLGVTAMLMALLSLQVGAGGVVLETLLSGISDLPMATFLMIMLPIHLVIGLVEGGVTLGVLGFLAKAQPDILQREMPASERQLGRTVLVLLFLALFTGGFLSWFASEHPDGLEWSLAKVTEGKGVADGTTPSHQAAHQLQQQVALMPDYQTPELGTSLAGLVGGMVTLLLAGSMGWWLSRRRP